MMLVIKLGMTNLKIKGK